MNSDFVSNIDDMTSAILSSDWLSFEKSNLQRNNERIFEFFPHCDWHTLLVSSPTWIINVFSMNQPVNFQNCWKSPVCSSQLTLPATGYSLSDYHNILTINPKYDVRLFVELHVQQFKVFTSNCSERKQKFKSIATKKCLKFTVQVNLCQKLFYFCRIWGEHVVYKNCSECQKQFLYTQCCVHSMFSPGLSLEFSCIELEI